MKLRLLCKLICAKIGADTNLQPIKTLAAIQRGQCADGLIQQNQGTPGATCLYVLQTHATMGLESLKELVWVVEPTR